jgi:hypothetical protein
MGGIGDGLVRACALTGVAQGCAVLRFVSFVLAPVRLPPGDFFQTAGSAELAVSSLRMALVRLLRSFTHRASKAFGIPLHL